MSDPIAWLNGNWLPFSELTISPLDPGFMLGITIAERLRTFAGRLYRLDEHLDRLEASLATVGVACGFTRHELAAAATEIAARNHALLEPDDDLGLTLFVTPGVAEPQVAMHTAPLPFADWADLYESGQPLRIVSHRQTPPECWPAHLKCRSRMHYYLADREAQQLDPRARALLLDVDGGISEASTASVLFALPKEGIVAPPLDRVLPSISVLALRELSARLEIPFRHRRIDPAEIAEAEEVLLTSTSPGVLPVTEIDGRPISDGRPGRWQQQLLAAWGEEVGVDFAQQARRFCERS